MQTIKDSIKTIMVSLITLSLISVAYAWTEPISTPPTDNAIAPINTSKTGQIKDGGFWVGRDAAAIAAGGGSGLIVENGNVGIGTVEPGAELEVAGQIKITGGAPGNNKVLTSDATGLASWATAASAPVTSIFGRTGAVVAASGDYSVSQVTGAAPTASPTFTGSVTMPAPTASNHAATKGYVDALDSSGLKILKKWCGSGRCTASVDCGSGWQIIKCGTGKTATLNQTQSDALSEFSGNDRLCDKWDAYGGQILSETSTAINTYAAVIALCAKQ